MSLVLRQGEPHEMDYRFDPPFTSIKRKESSYRYSLFFGGDGRDRTDDLLNAIQALSQLSYAPKYKF